MASTPVFTLEDDASPATPESAEIIESMPEPQQHAIDAAAAEERASVSPAQIGEKDSEGVVWDASIHATGADGKGVRTAKGAWRKRRGKAAHVSSVARPVQDVVQQRDALVAQARAAGAAAAASIFMIGRALGGEDWTPTADEVTLQSEAWGNYFVAKGITDFPPGMALTIAVLAYAGPRCFTPKTQERASAIRHWFAIRLARHRVKKELKKRGISAVVTIKGSKSANVYDSILINGKPFNEYPFSEK